MSRSLPGPPPPPLRKAARADHRQAACTHLTMTRLYDTLGSHKCQMCHRHPNIGWIYCCTQDHDGFLPESEFARVDSSAFTTSGTADTGSSNLSPWIARAIERNEYTEAQSQILQEQKRGVRNAISGQEEKAASSSKYFRESRPSSELQSYDALIHALPANPVDETTSSAEEELDISMAQPDVSEKPTMTVNTEALATSNIRYKPLDQTLQACTWKCCHTCRPTYRDRAYQSLDQVVDKSYKTPPQWELENRRISDARVAARLGLPKSRFYQLYEDLSADRTSESLSTNSQANSESEIGDHRRDQTARRRNALRETVKAALRGVINPSRASSQSRITPVTSPSRESIKRYSRSMLFMRRRSRPGQEYTTRVIHDGQLHESLMLMIAANTPLPDAAQDAEDLEGGEVEVEDGVALTEEGVGMSAADIIMQA